jgi:hypothetical protein
MASQALVLACIPKVLARETATASCAALTAVAMNTLSGSP